MHWEKVDKKISERENDMLLEYMLFSGYIKRGKRKRSMYICFETVRSFISVSVEGQVV